MVSPKIKLNFTPFLRRIYVVSCNPARISCGCFCCSPVGKEMAAISANQWWTILRYHRQSTDTPPTVNRNISAKVTAECRPTYRPRVGRYVNRASADMSTDISSDTQSTYRPRVSTNRGLYYIWSHDYCSCKKTRSKNLRPWLNLNPDLYKLSYQANW